MHDSQRMGEIPYPARPVPRPPAVFSSSPRILRPGSRQISLVHCQSGCLVGRHADIRRVQLAPKVSLFQLPSMEPLTVMQAVAGRPLTVCLSCSSRQPRSRKCTPQRPGQAAAGGIFFAAVHQAHRPTGRVAKLNSIHSCKPHDSGLVGSSWGDQSIHTIFSAVLV